jgi:hypothetical protein
VRRVVEGWAYRAPSTPMCYCLIHRPLRAGWRPRRAEVPRPALITRGPHGQDRATRDGCHDPAHAREQISVDLVEFDGLGPFVELRRIYVPLDPNEPPRLMENGLALSVSTRHLPALASAFMASAQRSSSQDRRKPGHKPPQTCRPTTGCCAPSASNNSILARLSIAPCRWHGALSSSIHLLPR